jgi:hypothetical protein
MGIRSDKANYSSGGVLAHNDERTFINEYDSELINDCFYLAGNGSSNYYHWLYEIYAKLLYWLDLELENKPKYILVNSAVEYFSSFKKILNETLRERDYKIIIGY